MMVVAKPKLTRKSILQLQGLEEMMIPYEAHQGAENSEKIEKSFDFTLY